MKTFPFAACTLLALSTSAWAQHSADDARSGADQRIERLTHSDRGAQIDEMRVGGEMQSITVQPAHGPAYGVAPHKTTPSPNQGQRMWNVHNF